MDELRREALNAAIREHSRRLRALAIRLLGDHHAAEDAVQDACVRAFQSLHRFRGDSSLATWLYRITSNVCIDQLRRRRPLLLDPTSPEADSVLVDSDIAEPVAMRSDIRAALAALPRAQRDALVLTAVYGFDYAGAGAVLGVPPGTVGSRVNRAKRAMQASLAA